MKLISIPIEGLFENTYLYFDEYTKKGAVIDPGGETDKIFQTLKDFDITVTAILLTHGHYDHISAANHVAETTGAGIYAHIDEVTVLSDPLINFSKMTLEAPVVVKPNILLKDGDGIFFRGSSSSPLKVLHTPGHTCGSVCYYDPEQILLFSGDTLFFESIGRTDFPTGNSGELINSIRKKLFSLPEETVVYPGHYHKTSIKHEMQYNPYLNEGYK